MRRLAVGLCMVALLGLVPSAEAKSLSEQLEAFHFETVTITIAWNTDTDRGNVIVNPAGLVISGEGARDLRRCIDDSPDCPDSRLRAAASDANNDGSVSAAEVDSFQQYMKVGLTTTDQVKVFLRNVKGLIKLDDQPATSISLSEIRMDGATGGTDSTDDIRLSATITGSYGTVKPANTHKVWMQRTEANLTVADQFVVQTGKNWRIQGGSVKPSTMEDLLSRGKLRGSQQEFQSTVPLVFTMEYHKASSPDWGLVGATVGLLGAAWARRKL